MCLNLNRNALMLSLVYPELAEGKHGQSHLTPDIYFLSTATRKGKDTMFCYQCEQAAKGKGCDVVGVCGKQPDVAALQDLLIYQLKGISFLAHQARKLGASDEEVNRHTFCYYLSNYLT